MDILEREIKVARGLKTCCVAMEVPAGQPGDIPPVVFFLRDKEWVSVLMAHHVDRDEGLRLILMGAAAYRSTAAVWLADTHFSNQRENPKTGKKWGPGEMQNACDHEGACDIGVIQDALNLVHFDGMRFYMINLPYHVDKDSAEVHWVADIDLGPALEVRGRIPNTLRTAFETEPPFDPPELDQILGPMLPGHRDKLLDKAVDLSFSSIGINVLAPDKLITEFVA